MDTQCVSIMYPMSKESGFRVRVEEQLRKAFLDACRVEDSTASQEIRKFMRQYVDNHESLRQQSIFELVEPQPTYSNEEGQQ